MNDTHDERGGDADPYDWDPVYAAATIDRLQKALATETATCKRWLQRTVEFGKRAGNAEATCEDLREQLAAATARAGKAEALVAGFGPACCVCGRILGYRNYRNQLFCWPCADGEPKTADASPDGRSEPVERPETPGGHGEGSNSSTTAAGLSELHAFFVCAACNGSGGYCQRCREGQAGLPHSAHIVTCPECLGGGTYPPATEDGQHG